MIDLDKYEEAIVFKQELECGGVIAVGRDDLLHIIDRLRQAEKDAARYRWLMENCGKILEPARHRTILYIPNYCPLSMDYVDVSKHIDEAMRCNK